ncbi:MAG: DNA polymerase V [Oleiphilaceae bacterium]|jgi:DNA polymerase V
MIGFESPASEFQTLPMTLDEILVDRPSCTFLGLAIDDSMVAQGIFDGDLLIVDRAATQTNLDVIVLTLNGAFSCKLINRKYQTLMSGNELGDIYQLKEGDEFLEEGIVIRSIRNHRKPSKLSGCLS